MRRGVPVVVHGDGTSLWTLTHGDDFAKGFVGLLGHPAAIGQTFHITSDEVLTWNQIHEIVARAAGARAELVHVPSDVIEAFDADWGGSLLGDKAHSVIFDNTKIRRLVPDYCATIPYARGAEQQIAWYDADPARRVVDDRMNATIDRLLEAYRRGLPDRR
jgi:nucleoside-diphosphate-sugar epimerase